jgi:hypothetical protein
MPGIVGPITKMSREWAEQQLQRMGESARHEAFYVSGVCIDESPGVYVGWRSAEVLSAGMPLSNDRGDVHLVFSGESNKGD